MSALDDLLNELDSNTDEEKKRKPSQVAREQNIAKQEEVTKPVESATKKAQESASSLDSLLSDIQSGKKVEQSPYTSQKPQEPEPEVAQPVQENEKEGFLKQAIGLLQKAVGGGKEFFLGKSKEPELLSPVPQEPVKPEGVNLSDEKYFNYMTDVLKDKQEVDTLITDTKQELINYFKDNISEESKYRELVSGLTVDNFDDNQGKLKKLMALPLNYKVKEEKEVGKGIFKHKTKIRSYDSFKAQEMFDRLKTLEYAQQDNNEFLGYEESNKGLIRQLVSNLKDNEYKIHPFSAGRYDEAVAKNKRIAIEKYQKGEELTTKDLAYIKSMRATAFNALVDAGLGDAAADVVTGSLGMGMQMMMDAQMTGDIKGGAEVALTKIPAGRAKKIIEKVLGNSVQLAVQSNYNIPSMDARTAEYMLPTVDYEKWLNDDEKEDILTYLKDGDDESTARRKAYLTNLVEYVSEGVGDYIDDAMPFVKKAFLGKWLKNRGADATGETSKILRTMHINGIVGEVIEEEIGQPITSKINEEDYKDPFFTPEGRERLLVEVLGIGVLRGMSNVSDATINKIRGQRSKVSNQISIPVAKDSSFIEEESAKEEEKKPPQETGPDLTAVEKISSEATNSLQNKDVGQKEGSVEAAKEYVENGTAKPVEIRRIDEGDIVIVDGRHTLEAARQLGKEVEFKDVTSQFNKDYTGDLVEELGLKPAKKAVAPNIKEETKPDKKSPEVITLYRGVNQQNTQEGNYFTESKEFAKAFTQSGQDTEIREITISKDQIYRAETLPGATQEAEIEQAKKEAKAKGYKAFYVDEGINQPNSVFFIDKVGKDIKEVKAQPEVKKYDRDVNLADPNQFAEVERMFNEERAAKFKKGDYANLTKERVEEVLKANLINDPSLVESPQKQIDKEVKDILAKSKKVTTKQEIKVFHGGNKTFTDSLVEGKGFDPEAKREAGTGGNFYGLSTTTNEEMANDFSRSSAGNDEASVVELTIKKGVRSLELSNEGEFVDDYSEATLKELSKDYDIIIDKNNAGGENEIRVLKPEALKEFKAENKPPKKPDQSKKTKKKGVISRSIPKNLQIEAKRAKESKTVSKYLESVAQQKASEIKNTVMNTATNKKFIAEVEKVDLTKTPQVQEHVEKIKAEIKKAGFDSVSDFIKASNGQTVRKVSRSVSKQDRVKLTKDVEKAILEAETQDDAIDQIDAIVTLELAKDKESNYINRLKALRASLNKSMYSALDIDSSGRDFKKAYAQLQTLRQQEEVSDLIDTIENHIAEIDSILVKENAGYNSGLSYTLNASFGDYSDAPVELGGIDDIQPLEFPEIVELARNLNNNPIVANLGETKRGDFMPAGDGRIRISRDLFNEANIEQASKTLAHEIGHLIDYLPDKIMTRGNLIGRLNSLSRFMKSTFGESEVTDKQIRKELIEFSEYWRPYDKTTASDGFIKYRNSGTELYADALSGLIVSPQTLKDYAPNFYTEFLEKLDKKSTVKEEYFKLQDFLKQGKDKVLERRLSHIYEGYAEAKAKREAIEKGDPDSRNRRQKARDAWHGFIRQHVTKFDPIYDKFNKYAKENGIEVSPAQKLRLQLEEMELRHNESFLYLDKIQSDVVQPLEDLGMSIEDLGVILKLERDLGQRKDIANPYGLQGKFAQETLEAFKKKLESEKGIDEDQFNILVQVAKRFRDYNFEKVEEATKYELYSKKVFEETLKPNKDTYATYQVVDYIHENYVSAGIKKAFGTLKAIENPFVSTVMKNIAVTEQIELQKGKLLTVNELQKYFPQDIKKSKIIKGRAGAKVGFKPEKGMEVLKLYKDGKIVGYDVDPFIAKAFETYSPQDMHTLVKASSLFNKFFKPVVTTYNVSWGFYSNIKRDASRTYRNLTAIFPDFKVGPRSLAEFITTWFKSIPEAKRFQENKLTDLTREMLANKVFTTPFTNFDVNANNESALAPIMRKYKFLGTEGHDFNTGRNKLLKPFARLLSGIEYAGGILESTSKIAGYQLVKKREANGKKAGFIARNYIGTPNYQEGGSQKQIDNNVFVFSNVMIQGLRTDIELATNPKTASGFWFNMFAFDIMPKLAMVALASGLFGDELKDLMDGATEYDKTNYIVVPIGRENGKTVYARIPQDETARLFSAISWKLGSAINGDLKKPEQIMSLGVGFIPSVTPLWDIAGGWLSYTQGRNPYDDFRGRNVIDDYTWRAGGLPVFEKMVKWTTNSLGLTQFTTYDDASKSTTEVIMEKLPVVNRAIKISDYGKTESEREIKKDIDKKAAQRILRERKELDSALKVARKAETQEERKKIFNKLVEQVYGPQPYDDITEDRIKRLAKKFNVGVIKGQVSREMDSLIDANTNEYKVELLLNYRENMSYDEFKNLVKAALDNKIISKNVIEDYNKRRQN